MAMRNFRYKIQNNGITNFSKKFPCLSHTFWYVLLRFVHLWKCFEFIQTGRSFRACNVSGMYQLVPSIQNYEMSFNRTDRSLTKKSNCSHVNENTFFDIRLAVFQDGQPQKFVGDASKQRRESRKHKPTEADVAFQMCPTWEHSFHVSSWFIAKSSPHHDALVITTRCNLQIFVRKISLAAIVLWGHPGMQRNSPRDQTTSTTSATFDGEIPTKPKSAEVTMQQNAAQKITLGWPN